MIRAHYDNNKKIFTDYMRGHESNEVSRFVGITITVRPTPSYMLRMFVETVPSSDYPIKKIVVNVLRNSDSKKSFERGR